VLLVVNVLRSSVLFLVDPLLLARGGLSAVGGAVCRNLLIDGFLLIFQLGGFASRQLAALDALRDAVLLVFAALADGVIAVVCDGVVLVVVDLLEKLVLLLIDLRLFRSRQLSTIRGAKFLASVPTPYRHCYEINRV
jgi:hypothetical protein